MDGRLLMNCQKRPKEHSAVLVDGVDQGLVSEENNGSIGDDTQQVGTHASIETSEPLLSSHFDQGLAKGVVQALIPRYSLSKACPHYFCIHNHKKK